MTREEAIKMLKSKMDGHTDTSYEWAETVRMAIKALENIGHLTDRPCDVCEFHGENGCCKWTCVFCDELFGDLRGRRG